MSTISKLSPPVSPRRETPAAPEQPAAPQAQQPQRSPFFEQLTRSHFVDRPTGLRPDDLGLSPRPSPFDLRPAVGGGRSAQEVTVSASAAPHAAIEDLGTTTSTLTLEQDVDVRSLQLSLDIAHTYRRDLVVKLTSPSGTTATVLDRTGGGADDVKGTFDLSAFAGEKARGTWTLTVEDKARFDKGTLNGWGLSVTGTQAEPPKPTPSGKPVVVVLDGGVEATHTDLDDAMWRNAGEVEGDGKDNDGNGITDDVYGFNVGRMNGEVGKGEGTDHGTHVAGIVAAEDDGKGTTGVAAGKAEVMAIGGLYEGADLLTNFERAVDYMVQMKTERGVNVRVVNCSFGDDYRSKADLDRWNAATQKLLDADILVVAATANGNGSNMDRVPGDRPSNSDFPNVVSVAALDRRQERLANFSSYGPTTVDLAAPGEDIVSTMPGNTWDEMSGTSMATPHVAAAAALLFEANPRLTAVQARDILLATVKADPDLKGKVATGGKLDIEAALRMARDMVQPGGAQARPEVVAWR